MSIYKNIFVEGLFTKQPEIPKELIITIDDIIHASKFKMKTGKIIKWMQENNVSDKNIGKAVGGWYYAVIGTTFSKDQGDNKYEPKITYLAGLINKYPLRKEQIKKDIAKTIAALNKKGDDLSDLQKAYKRDIEQAYKIL